jgi:hypothetical protein
VIPIGGRMRPIRPQFFGERVIATLGGEGVWIQYATTTSDRIRSV